MDVEPIFLSQDRKTIVGGYTHGKSAQEKALNSIDARLQRLRDKMAAQGIDHDAAEVLSDAVAANEEAHRKVALVDNIVKSTGDLMVLYMPKQEIKMNVGLVADLHVAFHVAATKESIGQVIEALKFQQTLFPNEASVPSLNTPEKIVGALQEETQKVREIIEK